MQHIATIITRSEAQIGSWLTNWALQSSGGDQIAPGDDGECKNQQEMTENIWRRKVTKVDEV